MPLGAMRHGFTYQPVAAGGGLLLRADAYSANVELIAPFDNTTQFDDVSDNAITPTVGAASTITATQVKWTTPDYAAAYTGNTGLGSAVTYTLPTAIPAASSGTYVVEGWFYANNGTSNANWCLSSSDSGGRWLFGINTGTTFSFANENNLGIGTGWHHIAIVCDAGTKRCYRDGVYKGAWVSSNTGFSTINIGQFNSGDSNDYRGHIQDLRVTIGSNRAYTGTNSGSANFTLPDSLVESF